MALRFFLGANSKDGFVSLFDSLRQEGLRVYTVKGGPGCGKATLIRRLAEGLGDVREYIHCSSDPDSLDGAVMGSTAILDGTAPHVLEPRFPGCDGDYLTLPPLKDTEELAARAPELYALQSASKAHYAGAYRLLSAAGRLREERRETARALLPGAGPEKRAAHLLRQLPRGTAPRLKRRFLEGITPNGQLTLWETVTGCAETVIGLQDSFGLAHPLLEALRDGALERGLTVYACHDPLEPDRLRHLLLPEAALAFVTCQKGMPFAPARTIRVDAMLPRKALLPHKGRLRLLATLEGELISDAVSHIAAAHALHDRMEDIYRPHLPLEEMAGHYTRLLERLIPAEP